MMVNVGDGQNTEGKNWAIFFFKIF
jgi:hypothetical protein